MESPKTDAETAKLGTIILAQGFHLFGHLLAWQDTEALDQAECKPTRYALKALIRFDLDQRFERCRDVAVEELLQALVNFLAGRARE
ncbi:MAG: hypothetical protein ACRD3I_14500, partial [Terriglobales bacterium]